MCLVKQITSVDKALLDSTEVHCVQEFYESYDISNLLEVIHHHYSSTKATTTCCTDNNEELKCQEMHQLNLRAIISFCLLTSVKEQEEICQQDNSLVSA